MIIRVFIFISFLGFACMGGFVSGAAAQPASFTSVTPEKISELESMHQQAID